MSEALASPAARREGVPRWADRRVLLGLVLVLVSIAGGARVLSAADRSQLVWVSVRDLAPGSVLTAADLVPGRVRLFDNATRYLSSGAPPPVGYVLRRALGAGELVPAAALGAPGADPDYRSVAVPAARGHLPPDLVAGQQVDVYLTPDERARAAGVVAHLVLAAATVTARPAASGFASAAEEAPVLLRVAPGDVLALVAALGQGRIDLVRVPRAQER